MEVQVTKQTTQGSNTMSAVQGIEIKAHGDVAILEMDLAGEKVNKFSTPVMNHLKGLFTELKTSSYKALIVISKKPKIYIAGADINEIKDIREKQEAFDKAQGGQKIISMLEDLPMPVIAAINGACLGGGCEFILACDYRIGSDDKSTRIGLPETQLGIIPGFGGCVRLPRVVGVQEALKIILPGGSVDSRKAKKIGLVDLVVPKETLQQEALKYAEKVKDKGKRRKKFSAKGLINKGLESFIGLPLVFSKAREALLKKTRGNYPAQEAAIEVIKKTHGMANTKKALVIEASYFSEVAITDVSKNLIGIFFMTESIKKQNGVNNKEIKGRKVHHLSVLGAGTMGGGIAQLAADKGIAVRVKDISHDALAKAFITARKLWEKKLKRRRISKYQFGQKMDLIGGGLDYAGFKRNDVVVEAIVEDMNIKKKVIAETAENCKEDCIIATNTSSLSVTEMATAHPKPENFVGMHFFNPVHRMPLIEVIRGEYTSDEVTATIFELSKKMGKFPVVVKDGPGFLVNRLLLPYLNEAVYLLEEGLSIERIDKLYLDFGMPMGPLHLIDEIGIDVAVKVAKIFHQAFGDRAEPSALMSKVVECGRLGVKNQKGFYTYDERGRKQSVDQSVYADLSLSAPKDRKDISNEEIINRGIFAMVNEAALALLDDKIVDRAEQVDLAMIMGTGFAPFRGGLLKHADNVGTTKICDDLEVYANKVGNRFRPAAALKELGAKDKKFYEVAP